jgi:hypothetical protein
MSTESDELQERFDIIHAIVDILIPEDKRKELCAKLSKDEKKYVGDERKIQMTNGSTGMHEIELYGGMRIYPDDTTSIIVQFDCTLNMDSWLAMMRRHYSINQFSPIVDRQLVRVVY